MSGRLFVPQTQLDAWLEEGRVDVTAEGLEVPAEGHTLPLEPAFRFLSLLEGEDDADLLSKVKTEGELRRLGAEPCGDSVLLGEVAYEVVPGFMATLAAPGNGQRESAVAEPKDAELLSAFFLGKVK